MAWKDEQKWEAEWHGSCLHTYWEETKQMEYAVRMGIKIIDNTGKYPFYVVDGKKILDVGGGPVSMLLKTLNLDYGRVVDPCPYPQWVLDRYEEANITYDPRKAEDMTFDPSFVFDEVWIYNVLQHTDDPKKIIDNAKKAGKIIRIFEWLDTDITPGHPHSFKKEQLDSWLGGEGKTEIMNGKGCFGPAYFGVFKADHYEEV